jgi:hypothetical protein
VGIVQRLVQGFLALCLIAGVLYFVGTSLHSLVTRGDLTEFLDHRLTVDRFLGGLGT